MKQSVTVLGSTGSIGVNTLDVVTRHPDRFEVFALSAATRVDLMLEQCLQFRPVDRRPWPAPGAWKWSAPARCHRTAV
jgi:1-deoxy-D-xylulose 5-phosphate reductoisomerase